MNVSIPESRFFFALAVLLVVHTAVSLGAHRWLTKTTVVADSQKEVPVEVTTREQERRGERVYIVNRRVVTHTVPWPVPCYIWAGYAGLGVSALIWLVQKARAVH